MAVATEAQHEWRLPVREMMHRRGLSLVAAMALATLGMAQTTQHWPAQEHHYAIANFHFGSGEVLPSLRLPYLTLGAPHRNSQGQIDNAVLLLHGTGGDAHSLLNPTFADELFGPGQPLDITRYFLIFPDDIGHGHASKPSDGLHARFPHYDYDDMVRSQHQLLTEDLHIDHLRLILGTSMGCMQTFVWAETYRDFATALVPLACLPTEIAGRNRMMRYLAIQAIKQDADWLEGEYRTQPLRGLRNATELLLVMGSSALQMQKQAPTRVAAEAYADRYLQHQLATTDANDLIYQLDASRNYDPSAALARISTPVLYINSADDYINPPELGIAERLASRIPRCRFVLLPISEQTRGHGTHTTAVVWKNYLAEFLEETETPAPLKPTLP